jgi:hypothetical protein
MEDFSMTVWKVTGEACTSGGSGVEAYYVLMPDDVMIPDVHRILEPRTYGDGTSHAWYLIEHIERVGHLPDVYDADSPEVTHLYALTGEAP